jgi:hypothetical protein
MTLSIVTVANAQFGELKNRQAPTQLAGITSVPSSAGAPPKNSHARCHCTSLSTTNTEYPLPIPLSFLSIRSPIMPTSLLPPRLLTRQSLRNALRLNLARSFTSPGFRIPSVEKVPDRIPHRGWVPTPYVTETVVCIQKWCQPMYDVANFWLTK